MTKTTCDRCGKELRRENNPVMQYAEEEWFTVKVYRGGCGEPLFSTSIHESFDLCGECKDALVAFIRGEEGQNHD